MVEISAESWSSCYKAPILTIRLSSYLRVQGQKEDKQSGQPVDHWTDSQEDWLCSLAQVNNVPDYHQLIMAEAMLESDNDRQEQWPIDRAEETI